MKKEEIIERYGNEYYQEYLKKQREYCKQYRQTHKEEISEYKKQHKEEISEYHKQYRQTQYGRAIYLLNTYRRTDKPKGFETDLTPEWIIENIFTSKCYYCEDNNWEHLGCDRIDNTKGHTKDNVICACGVCNMGRSDRMPVEEFKQYRQLHPRDCDIPKQPILNPNGCVAKKRVIL